MRGWIGIEIDFEIFFDKLGWGFILKHTNKFRLSFKIHYMDKKMLSHSMFLIANKWYFTRLFKIFKWTLIRRLFIIIHAYLVHGGLLIMLFTTKTNRIGRGVEIARNTLQLLLCSLWMI